MLKQPKSNEATVLETNEIRLAENPVPGNVERYVGRYSVALAARLVRFSLGHVRSYARQRDCDGKPWGEGPCQRESCLKFRDLMELRVAHTLHDMGMQWREICRFARYDAERFGSQGFVLSHRRFFSRDQDLFKRHPEELKSLTAPVEYDDQGRPIRWNISREWNIATRGAAVIVDPRLSFGYPVLSNCYVPTYILNDALMAENGNHDIVATDYEVSVAQVRLAHRFETMLWGSDALSA